MYGGKTYKPYRKVSSAEPDFSADEKSESGTSGRRKTPTRTTSVRAIPRVSYAPRGLRTSSSRRQSRAPARHRSKRSRHPSAITVPSVGPCPQRYFCRLKWGEAYTFAGAITNRQVWAGNGAVDPNLTAGTSQPLGWDQLQALYGSYVCYGSKIALRLTNRTDQSVEWVLYPRIDTTAAPSSYLEARQNEHAIWGTISKAGGGQDIKVIHHKMLTKTIYGQSSVTQDPAFEGLTTGTAQPTSAWYWQLAVLTSDAATNTTLVVDIAMEYMLEFRYQQYLPIPVV